MMAPEAGRAQRAAGLKKVPRGGAFCPIPVTLSASNEPATRDGIHLTVTGEPT